jgi:carboxyl-terminal processing protease
MTDPNLTPDAPPPVPAPAAPSPNPWAIDPGLGTRTQPLTPPPAPVPVRPSGFGGARVPLSVLLVLAPVLAVVMFAAGAFAAGTGSLGGGPLQATTATPRPSGTPADVGLVNEAWKVIHEQYVDPDSLDEQELVYGAIRGLTDAVGDEGHTSFMTAEEARAADQSLSGSFVGIGVQVSEGDDGAITITTVFPDTPAEGAGIKRGDRILAVDGESTEGETVDETVTRVRGPEGEQVVLTLGRAGVPDFDVTITRREFDLPLVSWAMVPGTTVAMIRLDQFATGATDALKEAILAAKDEGATGIVFDLRSNPGGYVNEAVGVASQFLGEGIVYQAFDRSGVRKDADVQPGGIAVDIPLVVLASSDTASSAEIVSGAIQDAGRGRVVGEKTFGTGTVLGRFDLSDGSSMRIGVERWLTRDGRPIWHEGLDPDVLVELADDAQPLLPETLLDMSPAEFDATDDEQVHRAVELLTAGG